MPANDSKFWGKNDSSSDDDTDNSNSDASSSDAESEDLKTKKPVTAAVAQRWADQNSSDDEDERRVVRSAKDKQWANLQQIIKVMSNHKKIEDFAQVQTGFDSLIKAIQKAKNVVEKEGLPSFFIKTIAELETYVNTKFLDKAWLKKLTKSKAIAFNTLRAKLRKGLEEYRPKIEAFNTDATQFEEEEDEEDDSAFDTSSSDSSDSSDSDDSDDDSDSEVVPKKKAAAGSDSDDNWSESDESETASIHHETDVHALGLKRWGKQADEKTKKSKTKTSKDKQRIREPKLQMEVVPQMGRAKDVSLFLPGEKIDAELLTKKLQEVTALRGRKGFDRTEQIRHLHELADAAKPLGPKSSLEVLGNLISAYFDANLGAFTSMPSTQWVACYEQLTAALEILCKEKDCYFPFVVGEEEEELSSNEAEQETNVSSTAALLRAQQQDGNDAASREAKAKLSTALICTSFLERLDDELTKALQLTDVHSEEYKNRLGQTIDLLALLWKAYRHFVNIDQKDCARNISLRILEQIYYKNDDIASRMWELVKKRLSPEDTEALSGDFATDKIVSKLVRENLHAGADIKIKVRVVLYIAYYESLHGCFHEARDLLQTANVQELASQCNISTQILFNRNLVQLGLAAFRLGLITEAHNYLSEVCAMGRYKELLAQGMSNMRGVEKSTEQEKQEKRRLLPYHMHIAADLVEAVHNICAMLLEVPYMAANPFDLSKKPIARNFRRLLEAYDRQIFTGPPENPREMIMAATRALQKGNWKGCVEQIMTLKIWSSLPESEKVQEILTIRIKQEALRTFLFSYSSLYESFSIHQLSKMFELPTSTAHSIVSKMMIQGVLPGSWDESSECVLIHRVEKSPLQILALQLTEKIGLSVDQNETMLNYRNPKYAMTQANLRDDRGGRRYDDRWAGNNNNNNDRRWGRDDRDDRNGNYGGNNSNYRSGGGQSFGRGQGGNRQVAGQQQQQRWTKR